MIAELQRIQRAGRVRITTGGLRAAGHENLLGAIRRFVGTMVRARRLAGIPDPGIKPTTKRERWDEDRVIAEIRRRRRSGESLSIVQVPRKLVAAACRYCGNWPTALELASLDYDTIRLKRRPWTKNEVVAEVKRAARARVRNPGGPSMTDLVRPIVSRIMEHFGGLAPALLAAEIQPETVMSHMRHGFRSKDELLAELRSAVAGNPSTSSTEFFRTTLGTEALARFGNHATVIDEIGEDLWTARRALPRLTAAEVIAGLQARQREGRRMTTTAAERDDGRLVRAAHKHFGTWRRAMEAAGLGDLIAEITRGPRPRSPDEIVSLLHARYREGKGMNAQVIQREHWRLYEAARRHFGSWQRALDASGLSALGGANMPRRLPSLSSEDVVRLLKARHLAGARMTSHAARREDGRLLKAVLKNFGTWRRAMKAAGMGALVGPPVARPPGRR